MKPYVSRFLYRLKIPKSKQLIFHGNNVVAIFTACYERSQYFILKEDKNRPFPELKTGLRKLRQTDLYNILHIDEIKIKNGVHRAILG